MRVEHWDPERDGPLTEKAMRAKLEALGYSVIAYDYPPGTVFDTHSHGVDKIDGVVSGRFEIEMEGGRVILEAGDFVWVPRGAAHSARVVGKQTVRSLDAVRR